MMKDTLYRKGVKPAAILIAVLFATMALWEQGGAAVLDAPHNYTHGITCGDCHSYSLWWQSSPATKGVPDFHDTSQSAYNGTADAICAQCHDDPAQPRGIYKKAHSSVNLTTDHGDWATSCIDCHNPHNHDQLEYAASDGAGLYLVDGAITSVSTDANSTIVGYSVNIADVNGGWQDETTWANLRLVVDTVAADNVYMVGTVNITQTFDPDIAIGELVIDVVLPQSEIDLIANAPDFGLIYGRLIRSQIDIMAPDGIHVESRTVRFFDPQLTLGADPSAVGGFVETTNDPRQGLCQVCHTMTSHWTNDAATSDETHQIGSGPAYLTCSDCHIPTGGFAKSAIPVPDHTPFLLKRDPTVDGTCESCHDRSETADVRDTIHSSCDNCHDLVNYDLIAGARGWGNATLYGPKNSGGSATCDVCHVNRSTNYKNHVNANDHSGQVTSTANGTCDTCHTESGEAIITTTHDKTATADSPCDKCHAADLTDGRLNPLLAINSPSNCMDCHGPVETPHNGAYHVSAGLVVADSACAACHADPAATFLDNGDPTVHNDCTTCHADPAAYDFTLIGSAANHGKNEAGFGNPNTCVTCHGALDVKHGGAFHDSKGYVVIDSACTDCHEDPTVTFMDNNDATVHNGCDSCHLDPNNGDLTLIGSAIDHGAGDAGFGNPNTCVTCHGGFSNHGHHDTLNMVSYDPLGPDGLPGDDPLDSGDGDTSQATKQGCAECHGANNLAVWTDILAVHSTNCDTCHNYANSPTVTDNTPPLDDVVSAIGDPAVPNTVPVHCRNCHTPKVPNADHGVDHIADGLVTMDPTCAACHVDPAVTFLDATDPLVHNGCDSCHNTDGSLKGSAIGHGRNDPGFGNPNTCVTCHGDIATKHDGDYHVSKGLVTMDATCSNCHTDPSLAFTDSSDPTAHNGCGSCHTNPATNDYSILAGSSAEGHGKNDAGFGNPNTCVTCHGTRDAKHGGVYHDSKGYVTLDSTCLACHVDPVTTFIDGVDTTVHNDCTSCHLDPDNGDLTLIGSAVNHGEGDGGFGNPNTCVTCHGSRDSKHGGSYHNNNGYVTLDSACNACHVDPTVTFIDSGDIEVHNDCSSCHNDPSAGDMILIGSAVNHGSQDGDFGNPNTCVTCHGSTFETLHQNHSHTVSYDDFNDMAQLEPTGCQICHGFEPDPVNAPGVYTLANWVDILFEHDVWDDNSQDLTGACTTCHDYRANGEKTGEPNTPLADTVEAVIVNGGSVVCLTCHVPKQSPAEHGGHPDPDTYVTETASCTACHDSQANRNFLTDLHGRSWENNSPPLTSSCNVCHQLSSGGGLLHDYSASGGVIMPADSVDYNDAVGIDHTAECLDCHNSGSTPVLSGEIAVLQANWNEGDSGNLVVWASSGDASDTNTFYADGTPMTWNAANSRYEYTISTSQPATITVTSDSNTLGTMVSVVDRTPSSGCSCDTPLEYSVIEARWYPNGKRNSFEFIIQTQGADAGTMNWNLTWGGNTIIMSNDGGGQFSASINNARDFYNNAWIWADDHPGGGNACVNEETVNNQVNGDAGLSTPQPTPCIGGTPLDTVTVSLATWDSDTTLLTVNAGNDGSQMYVDYGELISDGLMSGSSYSGSAAEMVDWVRVYSDNSGEDYLQVTCQGSNCSPAGPGTGYHSPYSHTITTTTNCATTCHTQVDIIAGVHNVVSDPTDCYLCHQSARTEVINAIYNGADGIAQNCANCHSARDTDYSSHTVDTHNLLVAPPDSAIQSDDCDDCHTGDLKTETHSGSTKTCDNCHTNLTNDATLVGAARDNHTVGSTSTCLTCHGSGFFPSHSYDQSHTVGIWGDTSGGNSCSNTDCHAGQSETWENIKARHDLANGAASVCLVCHDSTRTEANAPGTIDPGLGLLDNSVQGVILEATGNVSCLDCHFDKGDHHGGHDVGDFGIDPNCAICHDDGGLGVVAGIHVAIDPDDCIICHVSTTGGARRLGDSANGIDGDARLASDRTATCTVCHAAVDFDGNPMNEPPAIHHVSESGYGQSGDCAPCHNATMPPAHTNSVQLSTSCSASSCHAGAQGNGSGVPTDSGDPTKHNACSSCHDISNNMVLKGSAGGIADPLNNDCVECHGSFISKHATMDHSTSVAMYSVCNSCHDGTQGTTEGILVDDTVNIKHDSCAQCHGTTGALVGSAENNPAPNDCGTCHGTTPATAHHNGAAATAGNCDSCHEDPRAAYGNIVYKQMPCVKCHVVSDGASGLKVVTFTLRGPNDGADGTWDGNTQTDVANHLWPNTSAINNYGACFSCHGSSGSATKKPKPFHALPVASFGTADVGALDVIDVNLMGGGGWNVPAADFSFDGSGDDYRGADGSNGWNKSYFPIGKTVMNIAWAQHSQPKKATENVGYKENNSGLYADPMFNIPADMQFGVVNYLPHDNDSQRFFPVFDTTLPAGIDSLSGSAEVPTWTYTSNAGPITARSISVNVSSSDSSATLSLIYGGKILATGSNGSLNTSVDLVSEAASLLGSGNENHVFHTHGAGVIFVVSDKGGSIKFSGLDDQGQAAD